MLLSRLSRLCRFWREGVGGHTDWGAVGSPDSDSDSDSDSETNIQIQTKTETEIGVEFDEQSKIDFTQ